TLNQLIRKITPAGTVTTFAGGAGVVGSVDGTGSSARFYSPTGVAVDTADNVYVADTYNNTIRKVTPARVVTTLGGMPGFYGTADGAGSIARFSKSERSRCRQCGKHLHSGLLLQYDPQRIT